MSYLSMLKKFSEGFNPDYIHHEFSQETSGDITYKFIEFLASVDVECSNIPDYQRNILSSYNPDYSSELSERIMQRFKELYDTESGVYKIINKTYKVEYTIILDKENYRSIYCYMKIDISALFPKESYSQNFVFDNFKKELEEIKINGFKSLNTKPTKEDEEKIIEASLGIDKLPEYDQWSLVTLEFAQDVQQINYDKTLLTKIIQDGINKVFYLSNKKASWILNETFLKNINFSKKFKEFSVINTIESTYTNFSSDKKVDTLEKEIISLFVDSAQQENEKLIIDPNIAKTNLAIFYTTFLDEPTNRNKILIGFPNKLINDFPTLSFALDYENFEIATTVIYENLEDIDKTIKKLETVFSKKNEQLDKISVEIKNYDTKYFIKDLNIFYDEISKKIPSSQNKQKIEFSFSTSSCIQPKQSDENYSLKNSEYSKCLSEFVDKQTNLFLQKTTIKDGSDSGKQISLSSYNIDNKVSAYLFVNAKNIINNESSYAAKQFFASLVYKKTKFETKESFVDSTFFASSMETLKNEFVNDPVNLVKFSSIRNNIAKKNYQNKSLVALVRDALRDVRNLKSLYESILYKFDIKDLVDEYIQCYLKTNNIDLEKWYAESLFKDIIDFLIKYTQYEQQIVVALNSCGVPITGIVTTPIGIMQMQNSFLNAFETAKVNYGNPYNAVSSLIKCFDEVVVPIIGDEKIKLLLETYIQSQEARKIAKEQYKLLAAEARQYKNNPGSLKKSALSSASESAQSFKKAARNHWKLLQKQAVQLALKIAMKFLKDYLRELLKNLNKCKPQDSKDKNNNNPIGVRGDLALGSEQTQEEIDALLRAISRAFEPDTLCSLFNGSADDEKYSIVLDIIKQKFPNIYTKPPIEYQRRLLSEAPLTNIFLVKEFLISFSTYYPQLTTNKCDKYFEQQSQQILPNSGEKCIDFTQTQKNQLIKSLVLAGYSQEQATKIVEQQQQDEIKKIQKYLEQSEQGIYNSIEDELNKTEIPAADMVKQKIDEQLVNITKSYANLIDNYKFSLIDIINQIGTFILNFKYIEGSFSYSFLNNVVKIEYKSNDKIVGDKKILFKKTLNLNPIYDSIFLEPQFAYIDGFVSYEDKSGVIVKENAISFFQNKNLLLTQKQPEISNKEFFDIMPSIFKQKTNFNSNTLNTLFDSNRALLTNDLLTDSLEQYTSTLFNIYSEQFVSFQQSKFNNSNQIKDIKEFIYFNEEKYQQSKNENDQPITILTGPTVIEIEV